MRKCNGCGDCDNCHNKNCYEWVECDECGANCDGYYLIDDTYYCEDCLKQRFYFYN